MSKKSRFRGPFDKWQGKRAETLYKAARQHLYHIYWSLWRLCWLKKSLWLIWKILGLFVNPLSVDNKYSLCNRRNLLQHFQMQLFQKQKKNFLIFFWHFLNLDSVLSFFLKKRWPSYLNYFWIYGLGKTWLDKCLKKSHFRGLFEK